MIVVSPLVEIKMKMRLPVAVFVLLFSQLSMAQNLDSSQPESKVVVEPSDPVALFEEIIVVGERTFISIRYQITRAEDNLYDLFNTLNSSDEFDITCREFKINSHISRRICEPVFLTRERRSNTLFSLTVLRESQLGAFGSGLTGGAFNGIDFSAMERSLDLLQTEGELRSKEQLKFEALNEEIFRIAAENPEYLEALIQVGKLKAVLQEERDRKFAKP